MKKATEQKHIYCHIHNYWAWLCEDECKCSHKLEIITFGVGRYIEELAIGKKRHLTGGKTCGFVVLKVKKINKKTMTCVLDSIESVNKSELKVLVTLPKRDLKPTTFGKGKIWCNPSEKDKEWQAIFNNIFDLYVNQGDNSYSDGRFMYDGSLYEKETTKSIESQLKKLREQAEIEQYLPAIPSVESQNDYDGWDWDAHSWPEKKPTFKWELNHITELRRANKLPLTAEMKTEIKRFKNIV